MNDFVFCSPTQFVFGHKAIDQVGAYVAARGWGKGMIVYGGGSVERTGVLARVRASLQAAGVECCELSGIRPNPEVQQVRQGIQRVHAEGVDFLLPVGGGSAIDAAKAIAFGALHDGDVWDFFCGKAKVERAMPIAAVLTLPAAGSEASSSCVISNDELGRKVGTNGDAFRPALAFMEPEVTYTVPPYQTAAGITDIISHNCERYFSGVGPVPVSDGICTNLIRSVMDAADTLKDRPQDYDARATIMWASTLSHNDIAGCGRSATPTSRAGGWESHGLEHEMSALKPEITHGAGLAVIMPAWMRYVWRTDPSRFLSFGYDVFGIEPVDDTDEAIEDAVTAIIDELQRFFVGMGMPRTMGDLGLMPEDVDALLTTLRQTKGDEFGGFKRLTMDDARAIYLSAF